MIHTMFIDNSIRLLRIDCRFIFLYHLLGILVQRDEEAITNPTKGLTLLSLTNTIISYDSFINAINVAKTDRQLQGEFTSLNEVYYVTGTLSGERINAVIPLYINDEHMKRIRILEGIWLGYLYTLDSVGYDKQQEVGLLKLLYQIIQQRTETQRQKQILNELEKVCQFIINESQGFKTAEKHGEKTYEKLLSRQVIVSNEEYDLCTPLMIGYLKNNVTSILLPIYYEYLRQEYQKNYTKRSLKAKQTVENLIYGSKEKRFTVAISSKNQNNSTEINKDPDYIEKSFIDYFHDELQEPIQLIAENIKHENRRLMILDEIELDYIKSFLLPIPNFLKTMFNYCQINEDYIETNLNYEHLRWELLIIFYYLIYLDTSGGGLQNLPNKDHILSVIDAKLQSGKDETIGFDESLENIRLVSYVALNCKTLEGFAGVMRKYCPQHRGPIFTEIFKKLLLSFDSKDNDAEVTVTNKDKLIALLANKISTSTTTKKVYNNMPNHYCSPNFQQRLWDLRDYLERKNVAKIELRIIDKIVIYSRRVSPITGRSCSRGRKLRYILW
ncbi:unnamed protein product [Rotaria socialis]|uniref:Uncharacterized protein n=3 Tax=Rotaria socialis TaxID=392032 RepID=A0A818F4Y3_9BILA|nr:unnamed protein product [Rotaria socialis]CAF3469668.1 unnamed protein product [Rotaria socialis]CAF4431925.1 unnamed protein product [Rotaria socialis]CAF4445642.1 unnamed protein product [Rotaria socialis]